MKKFLKKNEIFFTTICAFLLSIMAIIVSWKSFEISEKQYQMDYFEKSPDFQIQQTYTRDLKTNYVYQSQLIISKLSGKAKNINIDIACFLNLKLTDYKNNQKTKKFEVYHYYDTTFLSGKNSDTIQESTGYLNHLRYVAFEKAIYTELNKKFQFVDPDLKVYVKISYLSFQNEKKIEYYDVEFLTGNIVNDNSLQKYFDLEDKSYTCLPEIRLDALENMDIKSFIKKI